MNVSEARPPEQRSNGGYNSAINKSSFNRDRRGRGNNRRY
ncbi:MAG: hypothetical protein KatS3mg052_1003 [Candidatus Roseilinea sp.]|nr:MAG: hypothetical protein KatS3mg052_1003 [Candidatus Roseilinea sp.]